MSLILIPVTLFFLWYMNVNTSFRELGFLQGWNPLMLLKKTLTMKMPRGHLEKDSFDLLQMGMSQSNTAYTRCLLK